MYLFSKLFIAVLLLVCHCLDDVNGIWPVKPTPALKVSVVTPRRAPHVVTTENRPVRAIVDVVLYMLTYKSKNFGQIFALKVGVDL